MTDAMVTEFTCVPENISLKILNFKFPAQPQHFKAILTSENGSSDPKHSPVIATFKPITSGILSADNIISQARICPGILEGDILPLISNSQTFSEVCILYLVEKSGEDIVYRSRDCTLLQVENGEYDLCSSCSELITVVNEGFQLENIKDRNEEHGVKRFKFDASDNQMVKDDAFSPLIKIEEDFDYQTYNGDGDHENDDYVTNNQMVNKKKTIKLKPIPCDFCDKTLNSKKKYLRHCHKFHSNESLSDIKDEEGARITIKEKKYTCSSCSKKFTSQKWLVLHEMKAHNIQTQDIISDKAPCPYCQEMFNVASLKFVNHLKTLHSSFRENEEFKAIEKNFLSKLVSCSLCAKTFSSQRSLDAHTKHYHEAESYIPCHICGESVRNYKSSLEQHLLKHEQPIIKADLPPEEIKSFLCPECGAVYDSEEKLKRHLVSHKTEAYPCSECGQLFKQQYLLRRHVKFIHLQQKNAQCDQCDKQFRGMTKLKLHIASVHTKEKPFVCEYCGFKCARIDNLNLHRQKTHGVTEKLTRVRLEEMVQNGEHPFCPQLLGGYYGHIPVLTKIN